METRYSPPLRTFLPASILLILIGWGGWIGVTFFTFPNGGTRWLFFFTAVLGFTGIALPLMAFLNRRFPSIPPPTSAVILRQALLAGMYLPILAWLQIGRVLTPSLALLLAIGFILIEWLLRMRERAQWKP
jgi:hypothetical protein